MNIRKHKCPVCPKKYTMSSSLSRHITEMVKKGDKAHMEHRGVRPKAEPLPLHPEEEKSSPSFASPPSVKREEEGQEPEPVSSDDLDELKLPGPEEEPDYVAPAPIDGIPAMAEVPYDNWEKVLSYTGDIVIAFGKGDIDSLTKMNKTDYELMAKHIAQSRGQDLSPAMAASVIYLKFVVFLISNLFKGTQRVLEKRREKMAEKAEEEKEAQEKVKSDGSIDRPEGA